MGKGGKRWNFAQFGTLPFGKGITLIILMKLLTLAKFWISKCKDIKWGSNKYKYTSWT